MTSQTTLLRQLEACVQEEIGAQGRVLAFLALQERALVSGVSEKITVSTQDLERELKTAPQRARRRDEVLAALAASWKVAPRTLSLGSVIQRAGDEGERLQRQRTELRDLVANVARTTRRNAFNARVQERVNIEVLQAVLAVDAERPIETAGALVDARA